MSQRLHKKVLVGLIATAGLVSNVLGQQRFRRIEEPQWLKWRVSEISAGAYAEGRFEETSFGNGGNPVTYNSIFVGPSLGLNMEGSIYHPYLLRYRLNTEGAYGWAHDTIESSTGTTERNRMEYLGRVIGSADLFANKPVNGNIFGNYDHTFRDYDFFSRVTVDSSEYGGKINYDEGPFTIGLSYAHRDEESSGLFVNTASQNDVVTLQGRHQRKSGVTSASYTYNQFDRNDVGRVGTGDNQFMTLSDSETFGSSEQFNLNSSASYAIRSSSDEPSDDLTANANLAVDHRPNLSSFYDLNFDRSTTGNFNSDNYAGQAQLRHQLYESLTSTLIVQASDSEFSDSINSGYARRFGGGFSESYVKHLGVENQLSMHNTLIVEHADEHSISTVENERHTFVTGIGGSPLGSFFLNLPKVLQFSIVLTDSQDTPPPFLFGIDYEIRTLGVRTLIERVPGSRIPADAVVLVDYQTEPSQAGSYEALNETFQIRVDLWKNLWGIYGRFNSYANNAPTNMNVPSIFSYALGTDLSWRWFRTGAEYEIYTSEDSDYTSFRLYQSFSFRPDESSSLGLELSESWTDYTDADRQEANYRLISIYRRAITPRLRVNFEGGINIRTGDTFDQTLIAIRPGLDYVIGRTAVRAGYDYEHEIFLNTEERTKHMFFVRAKRTF